MSSTALNMLNNLDSLFKPSKPTPAYDYWQWMWNKGYCAYLTPVTADVDEVFKYYALSKKEW